MISVISVYLVFIIIRIVSFVCVVLMVSILVVVIILRGFVSVIIGGSVNVRYLMGVFVFVCVVVF